MCEIMSATSRKGPMACTTGHSTTTNDACAQHAPNCPETLLWQWQTKQWLLAILARLKQAHRGLPCSCCSAGRERSIVGHDIQLARH